jgi:23S rRNA (adenine2503-C2)-methyltransferase
MDPRPHLLGLLPHDLVALLAARGVTAREAEARRVLAHAVGRGLAGFPTARPVSRAMEQAIDAWFRREPLEVVAREEDPADGFVKYLFRSPDGALSEAVRIPLGGPGGAGGTGSHHKRFSVCLSSQVGCALGCAFCATGRLGFARHLEAWEMVSAFCRVRAEAPGRVTGAVFMGQGEPLLNYHAVIQAARVLSHPCGGQVKAEAISLSTAGLVPQIERFTAERHPFRLVVSLTSSVAERRATLMPGAARWSPEQVAEAIRGYAAASGQRVTVAWVLLPGVNDGPDEVAGLARLFQGVPIKLNLIDVNDPRPGGFRRATQAELDAFRDRLRALNVPVVRRYSGGTAIHAACGMLAGSVAPPCGHPGTSLR